MSGSGQRLQVSPPLIRVSLGGAPPRSRTGSPVPPSPWCAAHPCPAAFRPRGWAPRGRGHQSGACSPPASACRVIVQVVTDVSRARRLRRILLSPKDRSYDVVPRVHAARRLGCGAESLCPQISNSGPMAALKTPHSAHWSAPTIAQRCARITSSVWFAEEPAVSPSPVVCRRNCPVDPAMRTPFVACPTSFRTEL